MNADTLYMIKCAIVAVGTMALIGVGIYVIKSRIKG